jgi:hypothetical protein
MQSIGRPNNNNIPAARALALYLFGIFGSFWFLAICTYLLAVPLTAVRILLDLLISWIADDDADRDPEASAFCQVLLRYWAFLFVFGFISEVIAYARLFMTRRFWRGNPRYPMPPVLIAYIAVSRGVLTIMAKWIERGRGEGDIDQGEEPVGPPSA